EGAHQRRWIGEASDDMDRIANLSQTARTRAWEAWRRLHNEYDPTSAMRSVTILGLVQNPPKCEKMESLGAALE
ncbi:unnamed protein product, partial [Effrenium voratum]